MRLLLTLAVLATLVYFAVGAIGRAIDHRIAEVDRATACLLDTADAVACETRTP